MRTVTQKDALINLCDAFFKRCLDDIAEKKISKLIKIRACDAIFDERISGFFFTGCSYREEQIKEKARSLARQDEILKSMDYDFYDKYNKIKI